MTNLSTFQIIDKLQTIAFDVECGKQGEAMVINANFLRDPKTSDRDRRAAFKVIIRSVKETYALGEGFYWNDKDDLEQGYYLLQAAAVADRSAKS